MAFTRKELKKIFEAAELTVPSDVIGEICELHTDSNDDVVNANKANAKRIKELEDENSDLKKQLPKNGEEQIAKAEYDKLKAEYDQYKDGIVAKETKAKKIEAYKDVLKDANVTEERWSTIINVTQFDDFEFDKDGKLKDVDKLKEDIEKLYPAFIDKDDKKGADPADPANGGGGSEVDLGKLSMAEYIAARTKENN